MLVHTRINSQRKLHPHSQTAPVNCRHPTHLLPLAPHTILSFTLLTYQISLPRPQARTPAATPAATPATIGPRPPLHANTLPPAPPINIPALTNTGAIPRTTQVAPDAPQAGRDIAAEAFALDAEALESARKEREEMAWAEREAARINEAERKKKAAADAEKARQEKKAKEEEEIMRRAREMHRNGGGAEAAGVDRRRAGKQTRHSASRLCSLDKSRFPLQEN